MRLVFDIETNGLLPELTTIHCIAFKNIDTNEIKSFGPEGVEDALLFLSKATELIGHNIINFDIPAIQKVYPGWNTEAKITDTLILSRLIKADLKNEDFERNHQAEFPKKLYGSHALKAWGLRLGNHKGDYDGGWDSFNVEMLHYMEQDVQVTHDLLKFLQPDAWSQESIDLEHEVAHITDAIGKAGWTFDTKKAGELYAALAQERAKLELEMADLFEPWEIHEEFIPKVNNKKLGYVKGEPFTKVTVVEFNHNSRRHIEHCLKLKYAWQPKSYTPAGHAIIDDVVLGELHYPEAQKLSQLFLLSKRLGQLAEGGQAWLKRVDADGKLRHSIVSNGTVTGRASHRFPNLAQVPATRLPWGQQCRELFTVDPGYSLCGTDLSGLELRCLAHFLDDGGAYAKEILDGDIHTTNQKAAGLDTRDQAKTFIYALLYGAGDAKIGSIIDKGAKEGKLLKERFMEALPAFRTLKKAVEQASKRGFIKGLDGRQVKVRSAHAALNTLLQSAGGLICKKWLCLVDQEIKAQGIDAQIIAWVHDELQISVKKGSEQDVCNIARRSAEKAGESFGFRIPVGADATIGGTWADTH